MRRHLYFCVLFSISITVTLAKESCNEIDPSRIEKIAKWSNQLPIFVQQDAKRMKNLADFEKFHDLNEARDYFYRIGTETLQTQCSIIKRFGGRWKSECGFLDGEKIVCMDGMYEAVMEDKCLVYSFGLADDWDFEESMAKMGCTVRAFDPNVERPSRIKDKRITFEALGFGHKNGTIKNGDKDMQVATLNQIIDKYGEKGKTITYLKLDVEGAELNALPSLVESGVFENVQQIGIEMHTGSLNVIRKRALKLFNTLLATFKTLQEKHGFRLIAYNANGCMGKKYCYTNTYHTYHDLVFYKPVIKDPFHR